jgi:hypothetical protein
MKKLSLISFMISLLYSSSSVYLRSVVKVSFWFHDYSRLFRNVELEFNLIFCWVRKAIFYILGSWFCILAKAIIIFIFSLILARIYVKRIETPLKNWSDDWFYTRGGQNRGFQNVFFKNYFDKSKHTSVIYQNYNCKYNKKNKFKQKTEFDFNVKLK